MHKCGWTMGPGYHGNKSNGLLVVLRVTCAQVWLDIGQCTCTCTCITIVGLFSGMDNICVCVCVSIGMCACVCKLQPDLKVTMSKQ